MKRFITCLMVVAALGAAAPAHATPVAKKKVGWTTMTTYEGGRWQGCLVAAVGERGPYSVIKLRANNFGSRYAHLFEFGTIDGSKYRTRWARTVDRNESTGAKTFRVDAGQLLSTAMGRTDISLGENSQPGRLSRC
jgi:hypothetical protein